MSCEKTYRWTASKGRLLRVSANNRECYNWLFVPGGPGLGSEYLNKLTDLLSLPGTIWLFDFPGDGSNSVIGRNFSDWSKALIEAICSLSNVILVTHSFSGMFVLTIPTLEKLLHGLVLMDSAPDKIWQKYFQDYVKNNPVSEADRKEKVYIKAKSNETLKDFVIAGASYCVMPKSLKQYVATIKSLPISYKSYEWHAKNFHPTYSAKWIPKNIPTLIFAGDHDYLTPLSIFLKYKKFNRKNILISLVKNAGHYPWFENPRQVVALFNKYIKTLLKSNSWHYTSNKKQHEKEKNN